MNLKSDLYSNIFENIDELCNKIQISYFDSVDINNQDNQNEQEVEIIKEIIISYGRDLKRKFNKKQYKSNDLTRTVLSLFQENNPVQKSLNQKIQILTICRKILTEKINSSNYDPMIEKDINVTISNLTDHAIFSLCNKYEAEYNNKIHRDAYITTNLKIVKNDLQKQLNSVYQLIKNTPTGLAGCDHELKVKLWNSMAENITGYQQADIIGMNILSIFSLASQKEIGDQLSGELSRRKRMKLNIQTKDGGIFNSYVLINKLKSEMKQKVQYIFNFVDLSKDEKLKSQLEKIEQLSAIARLSDAMMHDIRNPVNSLALNIDVLTDLLSAGQSINEEQDVIIKKINRQISNLTHNLNRYVGYSRLTELKLEPIDIREPLDELILDIRHQLTERNKMITYNRSKNKSMINGDWNQLSRVFRNLIDNAIDAVGDHGKITINIRKRNKNITIHIEDNGSGIKSDNIQNVFKPYFTTKDKGSGLGLFIVREIVHAHHGKVSCTSSGLEGTRFIVSIPAIVD